MGPLLVVAAAGVILRIGLILLTPGWSLTVDGERFRLLAASGMDRTAFVPPLYPFFLAAIGRLFGPGLAPIRIAQSLLGGATIYLVGIIASRLMSGYGPERCRAAAITASCLAAFGPPLLLADLTVMSESLAALLTAAWLVAVGSGTPWSIVPSVGSGILLGLATLCRAPLLLLIPIRGALEGMLARGRKKVLTGALLSTAAAFLVVAPWTARNWAVFGRLVPVSTNGGYNFWKSFNEDSTGTEIGSFRHPSTGTKRVYDISRFAALEEKDYDAVGYRDGWAFIRAHPVRALLLAPLKEGYLWGLERFFLIGLRDGTWGPLPRVFKLPMIVLIPATQLLWLFFAPVGFILAPPSATRRGGLLLVAFTAALHLIYNAEARYHVPLAPVLLAAASAGLWSYSGIVRRASQSDAAMLSAHGVGAGRSRLRLAVLVPILVTVAAIGFWVFEVLNERSNLHRVLGG